MRIRNSKDLYAGLMFSLCGVLTLVGAGRYKLGTAARMGPGFFPTLLGSLLTILGLVIVIRALWIPGERVKSWGLRPLLLVTGAIIGFAVLVQPLGLVVATLVMILVSCFGGREFHLGEVAVLCLLLVTIAVALFAWGLGIPFKIWPV